MRAPALVAVLSLSALTGAVAAQSGAQAPAPAQSPAPTAKPLDYDTFCKLADLNEKRAAFDAATPQSRGDVMRTPLERWRDTNKARLNDKQLAALNDLIAAITADTYTDGPKGVELRQKANVAAGAMQSLFTVVELQQLGPNGPCIAKPK